MYQLQLLFIASLCWPQLCVSAPHAAADIMELPSLVNSVNKSLESMTLFLEKSEVDSQITDLSQQLTYLPRTIIDHPSKLIKKLSDVKLQISNIRYGYKVVAEHIKTVLEHMKQLPLPLPLAVVKYEMDEIFVQIKEKQSRTIESLSKVAEDMAAIHTHFISFENNFNSLKMTRKVKQCFESLNNNISQLNPEILERNNEVLEKKVNDTEKEVTIASDVLFQTANALIEKYNKQEIAKIVRSYANTLSDMVVEDDLKTVLKNIRMLGEHIGEMTETKVNVKVSSMTEDEKCVHDVQVDLHKYWLMTNTGHVHTQEIGRDICLCKKKKLEFKNCHTTTTTTTTTAPTCESCSPSSPTADQDGKNE